MIPTLSHEFLHRWGAGARFKNADGTLNAGLLGRDGSHWSYLLDTNGSVLYGNDPANVPISRDGGMSRYLLF